MRKIFQAVILSAVVIFGSVSFAQAQSNVVAPFQSGVYTPVTPQQLSTSNAQAAQASQTTASSNTSCSTLTTNGLGGIVNCILYILDKLVVLLMAGAVVYVVYGAFLMISSEEKRKSGRDTVIYGIIGLFVMVSIWGFVNILSSTFNLQGSYIAPIQLHQ